MWQVPELKPEGWNAHSSPPLETLSDIVLYELHIRDFRREPAHTSADGHKAGRVRPTERPLISSTLKGVPIVFGTSGSSSSMPCSLQRKLESRVCTQHAVPSESVSSATQYLLSG